MDKSLIAIAILLGSILVIENYALKTIALVFIDYGKAGTLAIICLVLGAMLGYGIRGIMTNKKEDDYDDGF